MPVCLNDAGLGKRAVGPGWEMHSSAVGLDESGRKEDINIKEYILSWKYYTLMSL